MLAGPARRPCGACPYRIDAPSGVWSLKDYIKLPGYDLPTWAQPQELFACHLGPAAGDRARMCAGWLGCHGQDLLSLRIAPLTGAATGQAVAAASIYRSPLPLFASGLAAAVHGIARLEHPGPEAISAIRKISQARTDLH